MDGYIFFSLPEYCYYWLGHFKMSQACNTETAETMNFTFFFQTSTTKAAYLSMVLFAPIWHPFQQRVWLVNNQVGTLPTNNGWVNENARKKRSCSLIVFMSVLPQPEYSSLSQWQCRPSQLSGPSQCPNLSSEKTHTKSSPRSKSTCCIYLNILYSARLYTYSYPSKKICITLHQ